MNKDNNHLDAGINNFPEDIKAIFEKAGSTSEQLYAFINTKEDLIAITLRGHLVIENLLYLAVSAHCENPEQLKHAKLKFNQLVYLLHSLEKIPATPEHIWDALPKLNKIRNDLAHNIELPKISADIEKFVRLTLPKKEIAKIKEPIASKEALSLAIHYLLGALETVAIFQSASKKPLKQKLETKHDGTEK